MAQNINFITKTPEQIAVLWGNGCRGRGQRVLTSGDIWGEKKEKRNCLSDHTRALPLPDTPRRAISFSAALPAVFATQAKGAVIRRKEQNDGFCSVKKV